MARQIRFPHSNTGYWVNPEYAYADDSNYATADTSTDYVHIETSWYNFGFNIPAGSIINSVTVNVRHKETGSGILFMMIYTKKNGVTVGDANARFTGFSATEITTTKTDNGTWTAGELNLNDLTGLAISLDAYSAYWDIVTYVNYITVEVDFTPPKSKYYAQLV